MKLSMKTCFKFVEMLILAQPSLMHFWMISSFKPVPPCSAIGVFVRRLISPIKSNFTSGSPL